LVSISVQDKSPGSANRGLVWYPARTQPNENFKFKIKMTVVSVSWKNIGIFQYRKRLAERFQHESRGNEGFGSFCPKRRQSGCLCEEILSPNSVTIEQWSNVISYLQTQRTPRVLQEWAGLERNCESWKSGLPIDLIWRRNQLDMSSETWENLLQNLPLNLPERGISSAHKWQSYLEKPTLEVGEISKPNS
jgi:hypothetical protein